MNTATSPFFRDTAFDPFLFASVGEERNGMLLSVVSALARLDLDPWREAASLSKLPAAAATARLSSLLSSLPSSQLTIPAPAAIARLVGLLPNATRDAPASPRETIVNAKEWRVTWPMLVIFALAFALICAIFTARLAEQRESAAPFPAGASPAAHAPSPNAKGEKLGEDDRSGTGAAARFMH